jgi:uncharacterized membrane protein YfcA
MLILVLVSFLSAIISGITGLAGGVFLLAALTLVYDFYTAIAMHALIQVLANLIRIFSFKKHIHLALVWKFIPFAIIGGFLGAESVALINPHYGKIALAIFIMGSTLELIPAFLLRQVSLIGMAVPFLGMTVGASGPILAPFLFANGLEKEKFIATKSSMQFVTQLLKVVFFSTLLQFSYRPMYRDTLFMLLGLILGTFVSRSILKRVSASTATLATKGILLLIALQMLTSSIKVLVS